MEKNRPAKPWKRTALFAAVLLVASFILIDPFQWLTPKPRPGRSDFPAAQVESARGAFAAAARPAAAALAELAGSKRVTVVGMHLLVADHYRFIAASLPALRAAGVTGIGVEFVLADSQSALDTLVAAPNFDEAAARRLCFEWQPLCGYEENVALLRAAWQLNREGAAAKPFRVFGLSAPQDLSPIQSRDDFRKPEAMKAVYARGVPDAAMARRALELEAAGERLVVLVQTPSAPGRREDPQYAADMAAIGFAGEKRFGAIVHERLGEGMAAALLSGPWPGRQAPSGVVWPAGGWPDTLLAAARAAGGLPEGPLAWGLGSDGLGAARCPLGDFAAGGPVGGPKLSDLAELFIMTGPLGSLEPVTPIPDFITASNLSEAAARMPPAFRPGKADAARFNESIKAVHDDMKAQLASFR